MAAKFKEGKCYHITHPEGVWSGHVKVLGLAGDLPKIVIINLLHASPIARDFLSKLGGDGFFLGKIDWSPKEINIKLENK